MKTSEQVAEGQSDLRLRNAASRGRERETSGGKRPRRGAGAQRSCADGSTPGAYSSPLPSLTRCACRSSRFLTRSRERSEAL